jgi:nitrogen fixation protein
MHMFISEDKAHMTGIFFKSQFSLYITIVQGEDNWGEKCILLSGCRSVLASQGEDNWGETCILLSGCRSVLA